MNSLSVIRRRELMSVEFGLGMFFYNVICFTIGMIILYYVIRNIK